jgi:opacity protein-like surface antigen
MGCRFATDKPARSARAKAGASENEGEFSVRKLLLAGSAVLLLTLGAAAQQGLAADPVAYASSGQEVQAAAPAAWLNGQPQASLPNTDRPVTIGVRSSGESWPANIASALRTAVLIGFGCFLVGLSAVGVTALWVSDRTEESAREFEPILKSRS